MEDPDGNRTEGVQQDLRDHEPQQEGRERLLLRGDRAKLTADRVGYMTHPNWVSRFDRKPPAGLWQPRIAGDEGLKATAEWYRREGWL